MSDQGRRTHLELSHTNPYFRRNLPGQTTRGEPDYRELCYELQKELRETDKTNSGLVVKTRNFGRTIGQLRQENLRIKEQFLDYINGVEHTKMVQASAKRLIDSMTDRHNQEIYKLKAELKFEKSMNEIPKAVIEVLNNELDQMTNQNKVMVKKNKDLENEKQLIAEKKTAELNAAKEVNKILNKRLAIKSNIIKNDRKIGRKLMGKYKRILSNKNALDEVYQQNEFIYGLEIKQLKRRIKQLMRDIDIYKIKLKFSSRSTLLKIKKEIAIKRVNELIDFINS